jgi:hypothetical protein
MTSVRFRHAERRAESEKRQQRPSDGYSFGTFSSPSDRTRSTQEFGLFWNSKCDASHAAAAGREARTAGLSGGQSALHPTLCVRCRLLLPAGTDQRCRPGTQARLGHGQDAGDAIHAGPAQACRHPGSACIGIDEISVRRGHSHCFVVSHDKPGPNASFGQ